MNGAYVIWPTTMRTAKKPFSMNNAAASSDIAADSAKARRARCHAPQKPAAANATKVQRTAASGGMTKARNCGNERKNTCGSA
jgi:hypothetical protein